MVSPLLDIQHKTIFHTTHRLSIASGTSSLAAADDGGVFRPPAASAPASCPARPSPCWSRWPTGSPSSGVPSGASLTLLEPVAHRQPQLRVPSGASLTLLEPVAHRQPQLRVPSGASLSPCWSRWPTGSPSSGVPSGAPLTLLEPVAHRQPQLRVPSGAPLTLLEPVRLDRRP